MVMLSISHNLSFFPASRPFSRLPNLIPSPFAAFNLHSPPSATPDVDITSSNSVQSRDLDMSGVSEDSLKSVEADSFWCFSKLLDGIQDNYTFAQPGIQLKVAISQ